MLRCSSLQAGLKTFSVRRGVPAVFWTCITLLEVAYGGGVLMGCLCQASTAFDAAMPGASKSMCLNLSWDRPHAGQQAPIVAATHVCLVHF